MNISIFGKNCLIIFLTLIIFSNMWIVKSTEVDNNILVTAPKVIVSNFGNVTDPSLIVSDSGYMVAFCSNYNGNKDIWAISSEDGINWTTPIQITTNEYDDFHPSLIKTTDGEYYISYNSVVRIHGITGDKKPVEWDYYCIYITSSIDGINWSTPIRVSDRTQHPAYGSTGINQEAYYYPSLIEKENGSLFIAGVFFNMGCLGIPTYSLLLCNSSDGVNWSNYYFNLYSSHSPVSLMSTFNKTLLIAHEIEINQTKRGELIIINSENKIESKYVYSNNLPASNPSIIQNIEGTIFIFTENGVWVNEEGDWNHNANGYYADPSVIIYNNLFGIAYSSDNRIMVFLPEFEIDKNSNQNGLDGTVEDEDDANEVKENNPLFFTGTYLNYFILSIIIIILLAFIYFIKRKLISREK